MSDDKLGAAARKRGRPKGRCAGGYIEIEAPADIVWSIAGDWQGWGEWNPLYTRTAREPREGEEIEFTVTVPGMKPMDAKAEVYTYRPNKLFEYGVSNLAGMLRAFRFIDIEELGPERCGVANGEIMSGPIGAIVARIAGPKVTVGLKAMNEKMKDLAEAKWQTRNG